MDKRDATRTHTWLVRFNPQNVHRPRGSAAKKAHQRLEYKSQTLHVDPSPKCSEKNTRLSFELVYVMFHFSFLLRYINMRVSFHGKPSTFHLLLLDVCRPQRPGSTASRKPQRRFGRPHASAGRRRTKVYMKARCTSSKDNASTSNTLTWDLRSEQGYTSREKHPRNIRNFSP